MKTFYAPFFLRAGRMVIGLAAAALLVMTLGATSLQAETSSDASVPRLLDCYNKNHCICDCPKTTPTVPSTVSHNLRYRHYAFDYRSPQAPGSGASCTTGCGGSTSTATVIGMPALELERIHYEDTQLPSSLGLNWSFTQDVWLEVYPPGSVARGRPTGVLGWQVLVAKPERQPIDFYVAVDGAGTGTFRDLKQAYFKSLQFFLANGTMTPDPSLAASAVFTEWSGSTWTFEMYTESAGSVLGRPVKFADRNGNAITHTWKYAITDPSLTESLRAKLRIRNAITDAYGRSAVFTYDEVVHSGQYVTTRIDLPNGQHLTYAYADQSNTFKGTQNKLSSVTHPGGEVSTFSMTIDAAKNAAKWVVNDPVADPESRSKQVWFSASRWNDPANPSLEYNQIYGRVRQITDGNGAITFQATIGEFPAAGGGIEARTYYITEGKAMAVVHNDGDRPKAIYERNALDDGQPLYSPTPGWSGWTKRYGLVPGSSGLRAATVTDANGHATSRTLDPVTDMIMGEAFVDGTTTSTLYNGFLQPTQTVDRLGRITVHTYDTAGNHLTEVRGSGSPVASTWQWSYWKATDTATDRGRPGQVRTATDPLGNVTDYRYFPNGDLKQVIQPADVAGGARGTTTYAVDAGGRITTITDPELRTTTYGYDGRNRQTSAVFTDISTETWTYATTGVSAGLLTEFKDRNGYRTTYAHDGAGHVITTTRAAGTAAAQSDVTTFLPGNRTLPVATTRNGETTTWAYDRRLRKISETRFARGGAPLTTTFSYDAADQLVTTVDPYGRREFRVYNVSDRVVRTIRELVPNGVPAGSTLATLARITSANPPYAIDDQVPDAEGQILSRTDPRGNTSTSAFDAQGRLTTEVAAVGTPAVATTKYSYDVAGNRTRIEHPRHVTETGGFVTLMTYNGRNRVKTVTEASGRTEVGVTAYTYTLDGLVKTITDPRLQVTTNNYGTCCPRLMQVVEPGGFITSFGYDYVGNRTTATDANLLATATTYDAFRRPLTVTNALGKVWTYSYDENLLNGVGLDAPGAYGPQLTGLGFSRDPVTNYGADGSAVAVKDPNNVETVTVYDGRGRVVRTIDGLRKSTTTVYDQTVVTGSPAVTLLVTSTTDAVGATTAAWSDGHGFVRYQLDARGKLVRFTGNASGDVLSIVDANAVTTTYLYDAQHRRTSANEPGTGAKSFLYDAEGNLVRTTDAQSGVEVTTYDGRNRKTSVVDRIGAETLFTYDAAGNLLTIRDAQLGVTTYTYDARNLLLTETFPGTTGGTRTYTYDAGRRLKTRKDQTNLTTTYVYDDANRLVGRTYPDALNDSFFYDAGGRLTNAVSGRYGTTVTRTYDGANRTASEKLAYGGENWTVTGGYNDVGLLTSLTLPEGVVQARTYSTRRELETVKLDGTTLATRTYTDAGRLATTVLSNGRTETRTYRASDGLLERIATPAVADFTYTYDSLKRKQSEIDLMTPSNTQRFTYDAVDRLTLWDRISGTAGPVEAQQSWVLSSVGDWTSTTRDGVTENRTHTPVHEISTVGAATLLHDAKGNLTKDQQAQLFTWDVENRLTGASALVQQAGQTAASYVYDALGRRVRKTVGQEQTTWISWGAQEVYELARNPTAIAADAPPTTPTGGGATPVTGGSTYPAGALLADASATRITFTPSSVLMPTGWLGDTGAIYGVRSGSLSYGWVGSALNQTFDRAWTGWALYDTYNQPWTTWATPASARATWEIGLANGTYPVVIVCGDARSIQQRNDFLVEGAAWNDPTPWDGVAPNPTTGQLGKFVRLSGVVTVADGKLTLQAATTAKAPKICFIEIGGVGTAFDANFTARANTALSTVNARTQTGRPEGVKPTVTVSLFGTYVDDLLAYRVLKSVGPYATKTQYWAHSNHLYSVAAATDAAGSVVERYSYNAYGQQTIKTPAWAVLAASAVGQKRGFTGYRCDAESGNYYARARMFSSKLGRFVSRDPLTYIDGQNTYAAYFSPNSTDPSGLSLSCGPNVFVGVASKTARNGLDPVPHKLIIRIKLLEDAEKNAVDQTAGACPSNCDEKTPVEILSKRSSGVERRETGGHGETFSYYYVYDAEATITVQVTCKGLLIPLTLPPPCEKKHSTDDLNYR